MSKKEKTKEFELTKEVTLLYFQEEKKCSLNEQVTESVTDKGKPAGMRGRKAIGSQGLVSVGGRGPDSQLPVSSGKTCLA